MFGVWRERDDGGGGCDGVADAFYLWGGEEECWFDGFGGGFGGGFVFVRAFGLGGGCTVWVSIVYYSRRKSRCLFCWNAQNSGEMLL